MYTLGVLLYLLLVGRHPTAQPTATQVDRLRAVVEAEPLRPSDAIGRASGADAAALAGVRATTSHKLVRTLCGDLDNIVAKALKKSPAERYTTVIALADDLRRYLKREPVSARADSLPYRTRLFVRRHRFGVAAVAALFAALIAGVTGTTWQAVEASRQRDAARFEAAHAEASSEFMSLMLEEAGEGGQPLPLPEMLNRAVQLLEKQYGDDPRFVSNMLVQLSRRYMDLSQQGKALELLARSASIAESLNDDALLARALCASARARFKSFVSGPAEAELARGLAALARLRNPPVDLQVECLRTQAKLAMRHGETGSAIALLTQAHELHQKNGETRGLQYTSVLVDLGGVYLQESRLAEAYATSLEVVQAFDRNGRGGTVGKMTAEANLAVVLSRMGEVQAAAHLEQRVMQRSIVLGTAETARLSYAVNYASSLLRLEQPHAARDLLHGVSERFRLEKDDVWAAAAEFHLGRALFAVGQFDVADSHFAEAQRLLQQDPNSNRRFLTGMALQRVRMNLAHGNGGAARADIDALLQQLHYPQRRSGGELRSALALATEVYLQAAQPEQAANFAGDAYDIARKMARQADQSADLAKPRICWPRRATRWDAAMKRVRCCSRR